MTFQRFTDDLTPHRVEVLPEDAPACPPKVDQVHAHIDRVEQARRPDAFTDRQWFALLKDLREFTDRHLADALAFGWTMHDLYGCHPALTARRWDLTGVALMLGGREVESITRDRITILNRLGPPNTFYRQQPGCSALADRSGGVMIWTAVLAEAGRLQ